MWKATGKKKKGLFSVLIIWFTNNLKLSKCQCEWRGIPCLPSGTVCVSLNLKERRVSHDAPRDWRRGDPAAVNVKLLSSFPLKFFPFRCQFNRKVKTIAKHCLWFISFSIRCLSFNPGLISIFSVHNSQTCILFLICLILFFCGERLLYTLVHSTGQAFSKTILKYVWKLWVHTPGICFKKISKMYSKICAQGYQLKC